STSKSFSANPTPKASTSRVPTQTTSPSIGQLIAGFSAGDADPFTKEVYKQLIAGNINTFIELLRVSLAKKSRMSLSRANEGVLQATVEQRISPSNFVPELRMIMDGHKFKGSGRYGFADIFVLSRGGDCVALELKYVNLAGLMRGSTGNFNEEYGANVLHSLDVSLPNESEQSLLTRQYIYWSEKERKWNRTTISEILNNGMDQLSKYLNIIAKGPVPDENYNFAGVCDERLKATNSEL
ncbi:3318_t:CDS:1, partial [Dentiscutata heterogama]